MKGIIHREHFVYQVLILRYLGFFFFLRTLTVNEECIIKEDYILIKVNGYYKSLIYNVVWLLPPTYICLKHYCLKRKEVSGMLLICANIFCVF